MSMTDAGRDRLSHDEGTVLRAYTDTVGKVTIGTGRNITDKGVSVAEADMLFGNDIADAQYYLKTLDWFVTLSAVRQDVCTNMVFNLGERGFSLFHHMILALQAGDWQRAATELFDSGAARLLVSRYRRLYWAMITDTWNGAEWNTKDGAGNVRDATNWPAVDNQATAG